MAPPGALRASTDPASGGSIPVALDADGSGTATLPPDAPATVQVFDAAGHRWVSPVIPFETDSGGIPGDTARTRIVG